MTFSPSSASSSAALVAPPMKHLHHHHLSHHHMSGAESGYGSGFSLSRPLDSFDASSLDYGTTTANGGNGGGGHGEAQTTPRTTAAINYMSALQLSTPRMGMRNNRKGTPLKRHQTIFNHSHGHHSAHANVYETTPKKCKSHDENNENHGTSGFLGGGRSGYVKMPFSSRLDRSLSQPMSPMVAAANGHEKLDCTFDAISSSTPICQPFRAEFYEQQVEEIPVKNLPRSGGKNTRTKLIRKMQSFSPRKLMSLRGAKVPLREMDQNSVDFQLYSSGGGGGLFPVEELEESPIAKATGAVKKVLFSDSLVVNGGGEAGVGAFTSGLRDLMFGTIKTNSLKDNEEVANKVDGDSFVDLDTTTNLHNERGQDEEAEHEEEEQQQQLRKKDRRQETSSQLLDIYVTNLSNLDGGGGGGAGDSNSFSAASGATSAEDGDVSMNASMVADVERYFDELRRNTTQLQAAEEEDEMQATGRFSPLRTKNSMELHDMLLPREEEEENGGNARPMDDKQQMDVEEPPPPPAPPVVAAAPPMLLRKRKRPSTELIQAVLATPKKMRRSQSFHVGDQHHQPAAAVDENSIADSFMHHLSATDAGGDSHHLLSPLSQQRIGGARKRLNYEPVTRNRCSPAKRFLAFDGAGATGPRRRSLAGIARLNVFKHLANCPPVRDYFFDFVEDRDLVAVYAVSRQCRAMIEQHPRLNGRRLRYLEAAWRKKENNHEAATANSLASPPESFSARIQGEKCVGRIPLVNMNVDTSGCHGHGCETMSPPVSPSRRKFHENQKLVQKNPGACFVACPRCRSSSVIQRVGDGGERSRAEEARGSFRSLRSQSMSCGSGAQLMIPVRKQFSLPESGSGNGGAAVVEDQRMGTCQSIQCGFRFCVHCSYAFEPGHQCIEIGTLSPLIKQARQPRVVACSKQSRRNLKRL